MHSTGLPASSRSEEAGHRKNSRGLAAMRILMILIPDSAVAGGKGDPAVRLERAAGPYYAFRDAAVEVVLASKDGGAPLLEFTGGDGASNESVRRFRQDPMAIDEFSDTLRLDQVCTGDFNAAFCIGLPGPIWRSDRNSSAAALISRLLDAGKPVAVLPSGIDVAPKGAGEGLLIVGDGSKSPVLAAQALMGAIQQSQLTSKRNVP
jgi:hypothetical protein